MFTNRTITTSPLINREEVRVIFLKCIKRIHKRKLSAPKMLDLLNEKELQKYRVEGHCITCYINTRGYERQIMKMLDSLPIIFRASEGGGAYWNNLFNDHCLAIDRNGVPWAGPWGYVNELILLGQSIGRIRFTLPREEWRECPMGMPPFVYLDRIKRRK